MEGFFALLIVCILQLSSSKAQTTTQPCDSDIVNLALDRILSVKVSFEFLDASLYENIDTHLLDIFAIYSGTWLEPNGRPELFDYEAGKRAEGADTAISYRTAVKIDDFNTSTELYARLESYEVRFSNTTEIFFDGSYKVLYINDSFGCNVTYRPVTTTMEDTTTTVIPTTTTVIPTTTTVIATTTTVIATTTTVIPTTTVMETTTTVTETTIAPISPGKETRTESRTTTIIPSTARKVDTAHTMTTTGQGLSATSVAQNDTETTTIKDGNPIITSSKKPNLISNPIRDEDKGMCTVASLEQSKTMDSNKYTVSPTLTDGMYVPYGDIVIAKCTSAYYGDDSLYMCTKELLNGWEIEWTTISDGGLCLPHPRCGLMMFSESMAKKHRSLSCTDCDLYLGKVVEALCFNGYHGDPAWYRCVRDLDSSGLKMTNVGPEVTCVKYSGVTDWFLTGGRDRSATTIIMNNFTDEAGKLEADDGCNMKADTVLLAMMALSTITLATN